MIEPILPAILAATVPAILRMESQGLRGKKRRNAGRAIRRAERQFSADPIGCGEALASDWVNRGVWAERGGDVTVIRFEKDADA